MPRLTIHQRIAYLDEQKKRLQALLKLLDRARDTRRKVLPGAPVLQRLEQGRVHVGEPDLWLRRQLPEFLSRDIHRALFADLTRVRWRNDDLLGTPENALSAASPEVIGSLSFPATSHP